MTGTSGPDGFVGFVCGLKAEADCITAALATLPGLRERVRIGISGARPMQAEALARRFVADGASALVSFGIAGALDASLAAGDIVLALQVTDGVETYRCAPAAGRWPPEWRHGVLYGSDRMIGEPAGKAALGSGERLAIDMESHRVGRIATAARRPFLAVRAISDSVEQRLPGYLAHAVRADGVPRLGPVVAGLARSPRAIGDLLRLRRGTKAALASLRTAAPHVLLAAADTGRT